MTGEQSTGTSALQVLELLARDSPADHFHELLQNGRRRRLSQEELAALERAIQLGLEVHMSASRRRQREAFMTGLVDTVHDMASPYSPDTLLDIVTSRARRLLAFDMAYVSLRGPDGDSVVRSSDGDTTALNVGLRVRDHRGLGAMVRDSGAPFWTTDYLNDDRIPRGEELDMVVRAEGLAAIMAVPIFRDGVPIGALYGANRVVRHFTPDEISLMRSLADFASAALERAEFLERTQAEIADLEARGAQARETIAHMARLAAAQRRLVAQVLEGGDLHDLTGTAAEALGASLVVSDAQGRTLASAGEMPATAAAVLDRAALEAHAARGPVAVAGDLWAAPVAAGAGNHGVVLLHPRKPLSADAVQFLHFAAQAVAMHLVIQLSTVVAAGPVRDEFLDELLAVPPRAPRRLNSRAKQLRVDLNEPYVLAVLRPEDGEQGKAVVWASSYSHRHGGLKTVRDGRIVLLLPGSDATVTAQAVSDELSPVLGQPVTVGAAGPATGLAAATRTYQEALRCLDAMTALGGTGNAASMTDLGFVGMLLSDERDVDGFIASAIGPLVEHDAERAGDLTETIEAYFASGNSPTRAAEDLHVHTNTVARRLDRITNLLGPGWQKSERALEVQLALRLLRTRSILSRQREDICGGNPGPS